MQDGGVWRGLEALEPRRHFSAGPGPPTAGLTPQQVRQAYGFDQVYLAKGRQVVAGDGSGQTIAIVVAFGSPTLPSDLRVFDKQFGLPNQTGGGSVLSIATPQGRVGQDAGWAQESTLDVEWAHAIAPRAKILLVEAASGNSQDLFAAVDWARQRRGVSVVSMSWGWDTPPNPLPDDSIYTTPANHVAGLGRGDGVTLVQAAADDGVAMAWPDESVPVVTVGGTTLALDAAGNYAGESQLAGSVQPAMVAYDADPNTGFAIYDSTPDGGIAGWQVAGGTSAGTPQWAGLFAIANQGRALLHVHSLDEQAQTLPALANLPASDFHSISGATAASGRGSPVAQTLIADLILY